MVLSLIADQVADYVCGKVFGVTADTALRKVLNYKDEKELYRDLMDALKDIDKGEIRLSKETEDLLTGTDPNSKLFQKKLINTLFLDDKGRGCFVNKLKCSEETRQSILEDVKEIVKHLHQIAWHNPVFLKILGETSFREEVSKEFDELKEEVVELKGEVNKLKGKMDEIDGILAGISKTIDSLEAAAQGPVSVVGSVPAPSRTFTGREDDLQCLDASVKKGGITFVNGLGGIGKSELCRQYAAEYWKDRKVSWLTYEGDMKRTFAYGVKSTGIDESLDLDALFRMKMNAVNAEPELLIIIDNYEWNGDLPDAEGCIHPIIITTRGKRIPPDYSVMTVGELSPEQAWEFLRSAAGEDNWKWVDANKNDLEKHLEHVGYHTLAVSLMAGLILDYEPGTGDKAEDIFDFREETVRSRQTGKEDTVMGHIRTLFDLSRLDDKQKEILRAASMLPVSGMVLDWFLKFTGLKGNEVKRLTGLNMVIIRESENKQYISLHPLIAELVREDMPPSVLPEEDNLCRNLVSGFSEFIGSLTDKGFPAALVPYTDIVSTMSGIVLADASRACDPCIADYLSSFARFKNNLGEYRENIDMNEKALEIRKVSLPPDHPAIAESLNDLGMWYFHMGEHGKAIVFFEQAL